MIHKFCCLCVLAFYFCTSALKKKQSLDSCTKWIFGGWEQHERSTYNILVKQLGEEDSRTRESANWIKTFQIRENQVSTQLCEVLWSFILAWDQSARKPTCAVKLRTATLFEMALLRSPLLFSCQRVYSFLFPYYRHMPRSKGVSSPWVLQQCRRLQKLSRFVISHFAFCFLLTCTQLLCCCWGLACYAACSRQPQGVSSHKIVLLIDDVWFPTAR